VLRGKESCLAILYGAWLRLGAGVLSRKAPTRSLLGMGGWRTGVCGNIVWYIDAVCMYLKGAGESIKYSRSKLHERDNNVV
jgi:hypothetical protein